MRLRRSSCRRHSPRISSGSSSSRSPFPCSLHPRSHYPDPFRTTVAQTLRRYRGAGRRSAGREGSDLGAEVEFEEEDEARQLLGHLNQQVVRQVQLHHPLLPPARSPHPSSHILFHAHAQRRAQLSGLRGHGGGRRVEGEREGAREKRGRGKGGSTSAATVRGSFSRRLWSRRRTVSVEMLPRSGGSRSITL